MESTIRAEIGGERVLWSGEPGRAAYARSRMSLLGGSVFLLGFSIFWFYLMAKAERKSASASTGGDWFMLIFGVVFLYGALRNLVVTFLPLVVRGRLFYVATERRAIVFQKVLRTQVHSYEATSFERVSHGGRAGDLIFKRAVRRRGKGGYSTTEDGFFGLESFAEPEAALRQMAQLRMLPSSPP